MCEIPKCFTDEDIPDQPPHCVTYFMVLYLLVNVMSKTHNYSQVSLSMTEFSYT